MNYLTNKEAKAMNYTVIKHDGNLRTREKFRKHVPRASEFSNVDSFAIVFCLKDLSLKFMK